MSVRNKSVSGHQFCEVDLNGHEIFDNWLNDLSTTKKITVFNQQPLQHSFDRIPLPVYTLGWSSRTDHAFFPANGLDFLLGVTEVVMMPTAEDSTSPSRKFAIKIPDGETIFIGSENSSTVQRALFCSQRNFKISFLDPRKKESALLVRKNAFTNIKSCFRQEIEVFVPDTDCAVGRILQDKTLTTVSFSIYDENYDNLFTMNGSEKTYLYNLPQEMRFNVLSNGDRTNGAVIHKWDQIYNDFVYYIRFPWHDAHVNHKMLLIGATLMVEYTYYTKTKACCFN